MTVEISLKVAESIQDDVNKGIIRIESSFMRDLKVNSGDIIEIEGERKTVGIVDRSFPGDMGLNIIRMDGLMRRNAKTGLGETVKVRKSEVKEAKKVTIAPARKGIVVRAAPDTFKRGILGRAVVKGDIISLGGVRRRKSTMAENPFFQDIFSMQDEHFSSFFADLRFVVISTDVKGAVIITEKTEVVLNPESVEVKEDELLPDVTYEDIGGLDEELTNIREMVELPLKHPEIFERLGIEPPKGVLMHGPPGTGKTLLAKAVATETNAHFIVINGPEIMSKFYGESEANLRKKFEEAEKNAPAIIFIDEIDAIATKREESHGEVEKRVVAQLLSLMDGLQSRGKVIVIAASNIPNSLDPALRRPGRFDRELEIGVPGGEARQEILKIHTRNMPLKKINLKKIAEITHGFVGADLNALAKEAAMIVLRRVFPDLQSREEDEPLPQEVLEKLVVEQKDFINALKVVRPSAMREFLVEVPNVNWNDIGGMEDIRQEILEAVEWPLKHPGVFKRMGIKPPKGILIYGPPGTGKTLLAKAIATETQSNFITVKGPELLSKWVGESEKAIRQIFKKARQTSPSIIFFDEIDSIASKRDGGENSKATERIVNQLLTEMDGMEELHHVVVIAATNRPDILDSALLRPGRFDRIVLAPVPDKKSREKIFEVHIKNMPIKDVDVKYLAEKSEGYVGADIEAVCREAAMFSLRKNMKSEEILKEDFDNAFEKVRASVNKEIEDAYKELQNQFRMTKSKELKEHVNYLG